MSYFQRIAEQRIREAIENGVFENLQGSGKPLDHSDYFNAPPESRAVYHLLRNAGVVPEEVGLLKEISQVTKHIKSAMTKEEKERLARERTMIRTKYNVLRENRIIEM
jgi:hypothetical protein